MTKRTAKNWIQKAIKRPGALHREFGVPEDEKIPVSDLESEKHKLEDEAEGDKTLPKKDLRLLRQINLAETLRGMPKRASMVETTVRVAYAHPELRPLLLPLILKHVE
jgi:hypothetical protein